MHRRTVLGLVAALPFLGPAEAMAGGKPVFAENGIAIRGADPVAYFDGKGPVAGLATERVRWRGALWLFAEPGHREAFERDPRRFAPRFGGYCAYALSRGNLVPSDPRAFVVHDGRLYLMNSFKMRRAWLEDIEQNIKAAESHWPNALE